jgi:hypothetical protein
MLSKVAKCQREGSEIRIYNPASEDDQQDLMNWCRVHWDRTFCKDLDNSNVLFYHDCCICFSRRSYSKKNSHPPLQTTSVLKIPALKNAKTAEDFCRWLKERIREQQRLGLKPFFPDVNVPHVDHDIEDDELADCQSAELLKKRLYDLNEKHESAEKQINQLLEDNKRLLASSKSWCRKYQDLLDSKEDEKDSFLQATPKKVVKTEDSSINLLLL